MNLEWTEVRAPFAGYIANCILTPHTQVQAGKTLFSIIDLSTLLVDVEVLESETARIAVGQRVEISVIAVPDKKFTGSVNTVNPIVDVKSKTMKVTIELQSAINPDKSGQSAIPLKPGMYASVKIETKILRDRLLVPKAALLLRDQRTLVFRTENGLAKWCYVDVGEENEEYFDIRSGITVGDTIIVDGHYTLAHDARIKLQ
jgi:RND family efflux transporter MFP subunit